jgi:hypothetical protein
VIEPDRSAPLIVDFRAETILGRPCAMMSDGSWTVAANGSTRWPVQVQSRQESDGAAWLLYRRPHPLPETGWLRAQTGSPVRPLPPVPPADEPIWQIFEWSIPPGAVSMHLPLVESSAGLWIDGVEMMIGPDRSIIFPSSDAPPDRKAVLRVKSRQLSGGVFAGPVTYQFAAGTLRLGSWLSQGLRSYSGALKMRQTFSLSSDIAGRAIVLDLGRVRGTVEATLNGQHAGVRCLSPYRFEVTRFAKRGNNDLELLVTNTLANHLSTWGPTRSWSPDQLESGIFGPITVKIFSSLKTQEA